MLKVDGEELYQWMKQGPVKFKEEIHCPMIFTVMADVNKGTMAGFCVKARISDVTFYRWLKEHGVL